MINDFDRVCLGKGLDRVSFKGIGYSHQIKPEETVEEEPKKEEYQPPVEKSPVEKKEVLEKVKPTAANIVSKWREKKPLESEQIKTPTIQSRFINKPSPRVEQPKVENQPSKVEHQVQSHKVRDYNVSETIKTFKGIDRDTGEEFTYRKRFGYLTVPTPLGDIKFICSFSNKNGFSFSEYQPITEASTRSSDRPSKWQTLPSLDPTKENRLKLKKEVEKRNAAVAKLRREGKIKEAEKLEDKEVRVSGEQEPKGERTAYSSPEQLVERIDKLLHVGEYKAKKIVNKLMGTDYFTFRLK